MASVEFNHPSDRHLSEEELVWFYYGEAENSAQIDLHLSVCHQCQAEFERCKSSLTVMESWKVPQRDADYGKQVWQSIVQVDPLIVCSRSKWLRWFSVPKLSAVATVAILLCVAFFAGRYSHQQESLVDDPLIQQKMMAASLGDHLEQSERALLELTNAEVNAEGIKLDLQRAESLLKANRLYRQTAEGQGNRVLASVLDDLERVLLDVANGPERLSAVQAEALRTRVEDQELLFKVKIIELRLRDFSNRPVDAVGEKKLRG